MYKNKLVAVYGSLRKGLGNHRVLGGSTLVGKTAVSGWEMFSLGGFPGIRSGCGDIVIEVYSVASERIAQGLDRLEGYRGAGGNNFYDKEIVATEYGDAEIYTLQDGYDGNATVDDGDWYKHNTSAR
jgi:gamma-glutamylcyclotransferase (GGCT)/AIG2-like uncharacterized protein YtfP